MTNNNEDSIQDYWRESFKESFAEVAERMRSRADAIERLGRGLDDKRDWEFQAVVAEFEDTLANIRQHVRGDIPASRLAQLLAFRLMEADKK